MLRTAMSMLMALQAPGATVKTPQEPRKAGAPITVVLSPKAPTPTERLPWSPKGAKVPLRQDGDGLAGAFPLGPRGARPVQVRLSRSAGATHFDALAIDADRDGAFGAAEHLTTAPKEQRGKWWSSFDATVEVPFAAAPPAPARRQPYPVSLWFVEDPQEPAAPPVLRWSRRGWYEGTFDLGGAPAFVLVAEMVQDGVITTTDSWALARDRKTLLQASPRELAHHAWLEDQALRCAKVGEDGLELILEPFDPRTTRAEEEAQADVYKQDRGARRAASPLAFGSDFAAAMQQAARDKKRVLVAFATTWCGPCKLMDEYVYTAADVVTAAQDVVAVELDGDAERELVRRFQVAAYPTLLLLESDGKEVRRAVGYQGIEAMVRFLRK